MNPDDGSVIWRTALGHGTAMGGIHWGIAADDNHIYARSRRRLSCRNRSSL